ncbi:MAG: RNA 2'-phosphotransferase [Gemmatimonadota bacterium]|nr:RNA 2'-phosphotransferase [Gemmatimonadota bacterium]
MCVSDPVRLSRTVAHALRHDPGVYGLELDGEGWADLDRLIAALRKKRSGWPDLDADDLRGALARSEKRRFEIEDGRIRALYGHSTPEPVVRPEGRPPETLWHGTSPEAAAAIVERGLEPRGRQRVHLSTDPAGAREVGRRKAAEPELLRVRAREAWEDGVAFFRGGGDVWLADSIPARWVERG